ncbi:hypothetical protein D9758_007128 [Tetrapyrgos nigripes]|uniref:EH domain-containing protein n=1 Tax=Tetrapyrgos nigripes TaxID=182062 RepID=A0A8H5LMG3_9AGAR|nr:hypothetical protein D9758_007128 [Tetrapyrgos nigripes]
MTLLPQRRTQRCPVSVARKFLGQAWAINPAIIANAATRMRILDPQATGVISKWTFVNFYEKLHFASADLLKIWNLVDFLKSGFITQDEFVVALFFLHRTLVGLPLPQTLPMILVPPSIRSHPQFQSSSYDDDEIWQTKTGVPTDWTIPESLHFHAARLFSDMDSQDVGYIEQCSIIALRKKFRLGANDCRRIRKLLGLMKTPRVDLHLFTVIMFFIHWTLAGQDLPRTLPDALKTAASSPSSRTRDYQTVEPYPLPSAPPDSYNSLTPENQRPPKKEVPLTNMNAVLLAKLTVTPKRPVRPLPSPSSPLARSQSQSSSVTFSTGEASPVRPLPQPFSSRSQSLSLPPRPQSVYSSSTLSSPALSNDSDLRTEVDHLREMIERLMEENATLKSSVQEMQRQRMGQEVESSVPLIDAGVVVEDSPPPYEMLL